MSSTKWFVALFVCVWWARSADGVPTHDTIKMDLSEVLDKSVCPMKVVIDEDPTRIPRYIKTLKCDMKVNEVCKHRHRDPHGTHACCHHKLPNYRTECVELVDQVVVRYHGEKEPTSIPVPVGCTCMVREGTPAVEPF